MFFSIVRHVKWEKKEAFMLDYFHLYYPYIVRKEIIYITTFFCSIKLVEKKTLLHSKKWEFLYVFLFEQVKVALFRMFSLSKILF